MKSHPYGPSVLAESLGEQELADLPVAALLADMRAFPGLYYPEHLDACQNGGMLPLSEVAWRRACLTS